MIIIPLTISVPGFCKFICPQGILEGGIQLTLANKNLQETIGFIFGWKLFLLIIVLIMSIYLYRVFCRFICPLGAIYSFFNRVSIFGMIVDENKCTHCNRCLNICKMDIEKVGDMECIACTDCIKSCPEKIICIGKRK